MQNIKPSVGGVCIFSETVDSFPRCGYFHSGGLLFYLFILLALPL